MEAKSVIIRKPGKGLSRWMLVSDPLIKRSSGTVLKGHHPQFIFEIVPPNDDPNCIQVEFEGSTHYIMVRKGAEDQSPPPLKYLLEMLKWYTSVKAKPSLQEIGAVRQTNGG